MKFFSKSRQALFTGLFALSLVLSGPAPVAAQHATPSPGDPGDPRPLSVGATLDWNTFLGGSGADQGAQAIARDGDGNIYVVGSSWAAWSCDPAPCTARPFTDVGPGYDDGFVAKLSPSGVLLWNTFLGSTGSVEETNGVAVDGSGGVYVTGWSTMDWSGLGSGAFIAKLNASDGALQWVNFYEYSIGTAIAVDGSGNLYAVGQSFVGWGCAWPVNCTTVPFTGGSGYLYDGYVAKLNASDGGLQWNAFLGGTGDDWGSSVALDSTGNVYVGGAGKSSWGSPIRPYNPGDGDPFHHSDVFAAKLSPSGGLLWNTFLGGSGTEGESIIYSDYRGIAVDGDGNAYVTGKSTAAWGCSPLACTVRAFSPNGTYEVTDAFVAKLDTDGLLQWNTFLGSAWEDAGYSIAVDTTGHAYVAGKSAQNWGAPVRAFSVGDDAFAARLDTNGALMWNTFLGGTGYDVAHAITLDGMGNFYVSGTIEGQSWGAPVRPLNSDHADVFVAKVPPPPPTVTRILRSVALQDGWVLESAEAGNRGGTKNNTLTILRLGDDSGRRQYRSILSFSTGSALPDTALITSVKLRLRRQGIMGGGNPITAFQGFMIDIKKGTFGLSGLELSDFQSTAAIYKTGGPYSPVADAGGWYTISLPPWANGYINKLSGSSGLTQIRLRFKLDDNNNATANYLNLFSGNAAVASQPQLILQYYVP